MFLRRVVDLEPAESLDHREPLWQDAIVFVLAGELSVECPDGDCHRFRAGDVLTLARLPVVRARNRGTIPTRLLAIGRKQVVGSDGSGPCPGSLCRTTEKSHEKRSRT